MTFEPAGQFELQERGQDQRCIGPGLAPDLANEFVDFNGGGAQEFFELRPDAVDLACR